jgi:hypothetical protein
MKPHDEQARLASSLARFNVVPAGRRSGKTEIVGKRKIILRALSAHDQSSPYFSPWPDPRYFVAAPTRDQVKRIYWTDLKAMSPQWALLRPPNESQLILSYINGAELHLLGMDRPERIEGSPWDHGVLDEYGNMKPNTWPEHVRPALSDRKGGCDFIGVPEGRNHYYELDRAAKRRVIEAQRRNEPSEWATYWWPSRDILPASEIAAAKEDLDELTFQQEYEASFVNFSGRAYYTFLEAQNCAGLTYDPRGDLIFMFDFNVAPGVAAVGQEQLLPPKGIAGTGIIGEVFIPRASNTPMVVRRLIQDWGEHQGRIFCYGDYSGDNDSPAAVLGTSWQLIKDLLWAHFGTERVYFRVKPNPKERDRVNSLCARCCSLDGTVRLMVDPSRAPYTLRDFEGVTVVEGGSGELDKKTDPSLTHLTDAIGYYAWREFPISRKWQPIKHKLWK